ncbi:MAG: leucine-rich repeat domain-containing protein, partial [Chloroflexota bacterium]
MPITKTLIRIILIVGLLSLSMTHVPYTATAQDQPHQHLPAQTRFDCATVTELPQPECEALAAIYMQTEGDLWTDNRGWLQTTTPCLWSGVICDAESVVTLELSGRGLQKRIPAEIGDLPNLTTLSLSNNELIGSHARIGELSQLTRLELDNNHISVLPREIGNLISLQTLYLNNNRLEENILPGEMGNLRNLTTLWLHDNRLTSIPSSFGNLAQLEQLRLRSNQLHDIPPELSQLTNLRELDLGGNLLQITPSEIVSLSNLTYLSLSANELVTVPTTIGNLTGLKKLYIENNRLESLPSELRNLSELEELGLAGNRLQTFPTVTAHLTNLNVLNLSNIGLLSIPASIGALVNLKTLDLSQNGLRELSAEFANLSMLKALNLSDNQLDDISHVTRYNTVLTRLDLSRNEFETLPASINQLTDLHTLNLAANKLENLPEGVSRLTSLTMLDMSENQLTNISGIGELTELESLSIDHNQLITIPSEIRGLTHLKEFNLTANQLQSLPSTIGDLAELQQLSLAHNLLRGEHIPPEIGHLENLKTLDLSANQLHCGYEFVDGLMHARMDAEHHQINHLPIELTELGELTNLLLDYNCIDRTDTDIHVDLVAFFDERAGNWDATQTVPPSNLVVRLKDFDNFNLEWVPIEFQDKNGKYEIYISSDGPDQPEGAVDKSHTSYVINELPMDTAYYVRMRTHTFRHDQQQSSLWSRYSAKIPVRTDPTQPPSDTLSTNSETRALFIYAIGDNNLYPYLSLSSNTGMLNRLKKLEGHPESQVHMVILFDGIGANGSSYYTLDNNGLWEVKDLEEQRMDDADTLVKFLRWGFDKFDNSDYYALSILGHANGVRGMGPDKTTNENPELSTLEPSEIREAILEVKELGHHLNVVHFDGCSFGLFENTSIVEGLADYVIASPNTGWGLFAYDVYRGLAGKASTPDVYAEDVADHYATTLEKYALAIDS